MAISLLQVSKSFFHNERVLEVFCDFSAEVATKEFVAVLGPSGCGKTTLLRLIAGLEKLDSGSISIDGAEEQQPLLEMVFQQPALLPWRTALENVLLPIELLRDSQSLEVKIGAELRANELLDRMGLGGFAGYYPHQLSGGMRSRTAVARSLITGPEILLLDEPFSALDEVTRIELQNILMQLSSEKKVSMVFVTHSVEEAVIVADRVLVLSPRPATIIADIPIQLPRESKSRRDSREALELRAKLRDALTVNQRQLGRQT